MRRRVSARALLFSSETQKKRDVTPC